jgi:lysozyme family protein
MKTLADAIATLTETYSAGFLSLVRFVIPHEVEFQSGHAGDYDFVATEHDPSDPGGTTRYGLDASSHPHLDIEVLTFPDAVATYHGEIWQPLRGEELPAPVAMALCDAAINCGFGRSVRWLQHIAGVVEDGNVGDTTLAAVAAQDAVAAAKALNARRDFYYRNEVRETLRAKYLQGWENRVADLDSAVERGFASPDLSPGVLDPASGIVAADEAV